MSHLKSLHAGVTDILGLEAAGVVEEVGVECTRGFKKGDVVAILLSGGGYAEFAAVDERHAMIVPEGMSVTDAAAIPEVRDRPRKHTRIV